MNQQEYNKNLFDFIANCPTAFHTISYIKEQLESVGFLELTEDSKWQLEDNTSYFVIRNDGSIIVFSLSENYTEKGFRIIGTHSDSPSLQLKPQQLLTTKPYTQIGVEIYGSPILSRWFDRDLSIAGRVLCYDNESDIIQNLHINFINPVIFIPSLAIHLDRNKKGEEINAQEHIKPIFSQYFDNNSLEFKDILITQLQKEYPKTHIGEILSFELFCYDPQAPSYVGINNDFIVASRLDNLISCHAALECFKTPLNSNDNKLFICNNHEEIGSNTYDGANSNFALSVLERINTNKTKLKQNMSNSFAISMDNAHATHPNYKNKSEPSHAVDLNKGPAIKINANKRYATDSISQAIYKVISKKAGIPPQEFTMRNDQPCGSTIGTLVSAQLGIRTIDIGAPTLAMHSIRELTGSCDPYKLYKVAKQFLQCEQLPKILP